MASASGIFNIGDFEMGLKLLKMQPPIVAMHNERVTDVKRNADLSGVETADKLAKFLEVAAQKGAARGRMVLEGPPMPSSLFMAARSLSWPLSSRIWLETSFWRSTKPRR